jgi:diguanylate cyclase (GGDEF)-like protein/PAS domain S-box-containing protein
MDKALRILMIEDSPDDVLLTVHAIQQGGYTVYSERVDNPEELLQALINPWDLILCDYSMPKLSGMKALELVREYDEEIPFIILSGTIGEEKAVQAIKKGANDYVNKLHLILLLPAMERILQEKRIKKENKATKLALEETKERLFHAFHHAGTGVALVDLNSSFMEINAAFCTMLGYTADELLLMKINDLIDEDSQELFSKTLTPILNKKQEHTQVDLRLIHKNAQKLFVILNISFVKQASPNKTPYLIMHFQDRTEQRYFEEKMVFLTTYNSLTGLLNRSSLFNKINELIQNTKIRQLTLYYMDLDRFKRVNETYGAHLGDNLLKKIAAQLKKHVVSNEILGYLGGNEYIIIDNRLTNEKEALNHGASICSALLEPILMNNTELTLTASIGICQYPKHGKNINELLKTATVALQASKRKGGDCCTLYKPDLKLKSNHLLIENDLRKALGSNELLVYYQPQVNAQTNKPSGMETLVRWKKNGNLILPDEFIPIAEESSLILKIGEEILTKACACFARLLKAKPHYLPQRISVNLSARQFSNPHLIPMLERVLKNVHLAPHQLELEITETALIDNIASV